jgi:hypothetical protein
MIEEFDRIHKLGFHVYLNWGEFININMRVSENDEELHNNDYDNSMLNDISDIPIMMYYHRKDHGYEFHQSIDYVFDEFNRWYLKNMTNVDKYQHTGLISHRNSIIAQGDISKNVHRKMKIEDVIY